MRRTRCVSLEQCDGVVHTAPGWSPTTHCDLGSSQSPVLADGTGTATFLSTDPNHAFTPFKGESPQSLFNCLSPNDPALSPVNSLQDFRNCQIRVSTSNTNVTGDQSFLSIQLPDAVAADDDDDGDADYDDDDGGADDDDDGRADNYDDDGGADDHDDDGGADDDDDDGGADDHDDDGARRRRRRRRSRRLTTTTVAPTTTTTTTVAPTTTTTVAPTTTTTVAPTTTTTVPRTTTTTVEPTTTTTTTVDGSTTSTTVVALGSTTTSTTLGPLGSTTPTTTPSSIVSPEAGLPRTGGNTTPVALLGIAFVAAGVALAAGNRKRTT